MPPRHRRRHAARASASAGAPPGPARPWQRKISSASKMPRGRHPVEYAVARAAGRRREAIRAARFRRLRQRHQQRRLAEREPLRLLAEIGERRRPDAFEIAAIGGEAQVKRQHLVLTQVPLDLEGAHDLPQFGRKLPLAARFQEPRHLHGQRRAAGLDAPAGRRIARRRAARPADRRRDGRGIACPHRRTACEKRGSTSATRAGKRQRPASVA